MVHSHASKLVQKGKLVLKATGNRNNNKVHEFTQQA